MIKSSTTSTSTYSIHLKCLTSHWDSEQGFSKEEKKKKNRMERKKGIGALPQTGDKFKEKPQAARTALMRLTIGSLTLTKWF